MHASNLYIMPLFPSAFFVILSEINYCDVLSYLLQLCCFLSLLPTGFFLIFQFSILVIFSFNKYKHSLDASELCFCFMLIFAL